MEGGEGMLALGSPLARTRYSIDGIVLKEDGWVPLAQRPHPLRPMNISRNSFSGLLGFFFTPVLSSFPIKCAALFFSARVANRLISRLPRRLGRIAGQAFISRRERESKCGGSQTRDSYFLVGVALGLYYTVF